MDKLLTILDATGLPHTYRQWKPKKPPALPYVVFFFTDSNNFAADNIAHHTVGNYDIELYSVSKDSVSEAKIETALTEHEVFFEKTEAWIESEELYQIVYSIQI